MKRPKMKREVANSMPVLGMLVGLMLGLAVDPFSYSVMWWPAAIGLAIGIVIMLVVRRSDDAR